MVKRYWLVIVLAAGIVVGVALHALLFGGNVESDEWLARGAERAKAAEAGAPAPAPAKPNPAPAPARSGDRTADPSADSPAPQVALDIVPGDANAGFVQGDIINAPPSRNVENMETMHADFVREERDDSWAYLREAELENSVVMETSVGNFSRERVECRATLCEMDLSASGEQIDKLKKWYDDLNAQRPGISLQAPLMMRMSSFSSDNNQAAVKFVYVRPQRVLPPPPRAN